MKKSKIKRVITEAMAVYYESGFTNTADKVKRNIFKSIDNLYSSSKQNKR